MPQTYNEIRTLRRLHPDHAEKRYGSEDESAGVALWAVACIVGASFLWALMTWWQA